MLVALSYTKNMFEGKRQKRSGAGRCLKKLRSCSIRLLLCVENWGRGRRVNVFIFRIGILIPILQWGLGNVVIQVEVTSFVHEDWRGGWGG